MIAPFVLAAALAGVFLGLLGYVHHDGQAKGYRKHQLEVAEAVEATNRRIAEINARAEDMIAKANADRDAAAERANAHEVASTGCVLPEHVRLDINRINRR